MGEKRKSFQRINCALSQIAFFSTDEMYVVIDVLGKALII
jgi:hypothetical protein